MSHDPGRVSEAVGDRFRVLREIGEGGMATVYLAEDRKHRRQVAIKVFDRAIGADVGAERFEREIETIAGLHHPHILPLHDSGRAAGLIYFVMPFVEEGTLGDRIHREGPLPVADALRIAKEVADALEHAHRRGVVHRDVKPANIMLDSGHAVVTDFGIAFLVEGDRGERLTDAGASPGTPEYMSPEQVGGAGPVDPRSDIYSLGCVLYEMLAGDPPFTGSSGQAVVARKLVDPVPPVRTVRKSVPEAVERATLEALERVPADRYRSAGEFAERLARLESALSAAEPRETDLGGRSPVQLAALAAPAAVAGAVLLTGIGMLSTRVFDQKVQMPPMFQPSRSDYLVVGAQAVFPLVVWGALALAAWFLLSRYLLPLSGRGVARLTTAVGARVTRSWRKTWRRIRPSSGPRGVADLFVLGMLVASALVLWPFRDLYFALFYDPAPDVLGCGSRSFHRLHTWTLAFLIVCVGMGRQVVSRWLRGRRRGSDARAWTVARWASAGWLVILVVVMTLPWRVLWDSHFERVRIDGEPAYLMAEEEGDLLAYASEGPGGRGSVRIFDADAVDVERIGVVGYLFEEPEVFESSRRGCSAVSNAESDS